MAKQANSNNQPYTFRNIPSGFFHTKNRYHLGKHMYGDRSADKRGDINEIMRDYNNAVAVRRIADDIQEQDG